MSLFQQPAAGRPLPITIVCVIGFIGALFTIPAMFTDIPGQLHPWYPSLLLFSTVVGAVCLVGFWKMRRWAVYTYTAFTIVTQGVLFQMGHWNLFAIVPPGSVIAIGFIYLPRMR
jgi:hypothetical protein